MVIQEEDFQGFVKGDEKSFEVIFCQYYKTLVSFAMRYGLEQMEAEDVVIEVTHHIWERRRDVKSPAALHTLFYTSVRNRTLNIYRNNKNRQRIISAREENEEEEFRDYVIEEEVSRLLDEAIASLPSQCRQVISGLMGGKSVVEIAAEMKISVNTVKTHKLRAIDILRGAFKEHPFLIGCILFRISIQDKK